MGRRVDFRFWIGSRGGKPEESKIQNLKSKMVREFERILRA
jgi:hypothetical protein